MDSVKTLLNPPSYFAAPRPCIDFAGVCRACGSPVLPSWRYCTNCIEAAELDRLAEILTFHFIAMIEAKGARAA